MVLSDHFHFAGRKGAYVAKRFDRETASAEFGKNANRTAHFRFQPKKKKEKKIGCMPDLPPLLLYIRRIA
jgi:hypothetical protein